MNKLTLFKGRAMAFLILIFLFLAQSCSKDRFHLITPSEEHGNQLLAESTLNQIIEDNPAFKSFTLDWNKARQGTLRGKHVVRIPVINNDNITGMINNGTFDNQGQSLRSESKSNGVRKPGSNINYSNHTPPEVFFIQDDEDGKLHSYLLNFVPENKNTNSKGNWRGKLYEWNLTGDTIFVQNVENNVIEESFGLKLGQDPTIDNLAITLKNGKLQSLGGLKDKKISNFWKWLAYLPANVIGWVGNLFGLSEYSENYSGGAGGYRINIFRGGSNSNGTSGSTNSGENGTIATVFNGILNSGGAYLSSGWPIYNAYIPGVYYEDGSRNIVTDGGGTAGDPNATSLEGSFEPYPTTHGPNVNLNTLTADYVITELGIGTYEQQAFLRSPNNIEITAAFADYIDNLQTINQPDIEFGQWAVGYLMNTDSYANFITLLNINGGNANIDPAIFRIYFSIQCAIIKTEHPEYPEWKVRWEASQEMLHLVLDGIGFVPGYGEVADLTNGAIYAIQGDGVNATLSATSAIPFVGWFTMGAKYAKKTINLANGSKTTLKWVRKAGNFVNFGSSGQLRTILGLVPGDKLRQAHHIIPWGKQTHEVVQRAAKANGANPFHMNSALNGVAVATWKNQPNHYAYDNRVVERLNEILSSNPTPQQANEQIGDLIDNIRNAIINNPNSHLNDLIF